jgi:hypothetical protein
MASKVKKGIVTVEYPNGEKEVFRSCRGIIIAEAIGDRLDHAYVTYRYPGCDTYMVRQNGNWTTMREGEEG